MIQVTTAAPETLSVDWLLIVTPDVDALPADLSDLNGQLGGRLQSVLERGEFAGDHAQTLALRQLQEIEPVNLLLIGAGAVDQLSPERLRRALLTGMRRVNQQEDQTAAVLFCDAVSGSFSAGQLVELAADCATVASTDAGIHKTKPTRHEFSAVEVVVGESADESESVRHGQTIGQAVVCVRQLVNRSALQMTPARVVAEAREIAAMEGLEIEVLDREQLAAENMNAMLAVAQGSDEPPALVRISWQGRPDSDEQLALVGKGVTFDSGGLSIKPTASMISMKADMAGAATALATVHAAARLQLPVNVTAWLGLVENMISGRAYRPGDVLTARTGTTIEVQNTDAEGRLVLADVLSYAIDHGATHVIDLATLTGACVVALGDDVTGMFPGCDQLAAEIRQAADVSGEYVWPMPMYDHFDDLLKSDVADCRNVGPRWGGAITAACFLRRFVGTTPWVHLDIAGPSWADTSSGWRDSGGTGAVVRTLVEFLRARAGTAETSASG